VLSPVNVDDLRASADDQNVLLTCWTVALCRSSVHGALQTASASDKPSLQRQLAQIDRDIETADKEITKMSFVIPQARDKLC